MFDDLGRVAVAAENLLSVQSGTAGHRATVGAFYANRRSAARCVLVQFGLEFLPIEWGIDQGSASIISGVGVWVGRRRTFYFFGLSVSWLRFWPPSKSAFLDFAGVFLHANGLVIIEFYHVVILEVGDFQITRYIVVF